MSWKEFEQGNPKLAQFGKRRFGSGVAYLGTVSKNGFPRVHPVSPIINGGEMYVFMYPTSPKGKDLLERKKYALHCQVEDKDGGHGEFYVRGEGKLVENEEIWEKLRSGKVKEMKEKYILFSLSIDFAFSMIYDGDTIVKNSWKS